MILYYFRLTLKKKKYFMYTWFNSDKQVFTAKLTKDAQTLSILKKNQENFRLLSIK